MNIFDIEPWFRFKNFEFYCLIVSTNYAILCLFRNCFRKQANGYFDHLWIDEEYLCKGRRFVYWKVADQRRNYGISRFYKYFWLLILIYFKNADGDYGIVDTVGDQWREHRRFALQTFRDLGLGNNILQERVFVSKAIMIYYFMFVDSFRSGGINARIGWKFKKSSWIFNDWYLGLACCLRN